MNNIVKISLFAVLLGVFAFAGVSLASSALQATIAAPAASASFEVGETVTLTGQASGGTGVYPSYRWTFSDGTSAIVGANQQVAFQTAGSKIITLTVTDSAGDYNVTSVTVNVTAEPAEELVISNVRVTNITQTSVTILWDTNLSATSRVIYDTTSHPDISGETAPNYGYAASTAISDTDPKVTSHSVNLTGLNPGTRYYFRVVSE